MSPVTDVKAKKRHISTKSSFINTFNPRPTATVSPNFIKEAMPSRVKEGGHGAARGYDKPESTVSPQGEKSKEEEKLTRECYTGGVEGQRQSISLLSSMMFSGGSGCDPAKLQGLENTTLSGCVKLLSLVGFLGSPPPPFLASITQPSNSIIL